MTSRRRPPPVDEHRFHEAQKEFAIKSTPPFKDLRRHVEALIDTTTSVADPIISGDRLKDNPENNLNNRNFENEIKAINIALSQLNKHLSDFANAINLLPIDTPAIPADTHRKLNEAAKQIDLIRTECSRQQGALDDTARRQALLAETATNGLESAKVIAAQVSILKDDILAKRSEATGAITKISEDAASLAAAAGQATVESENISSASRSAQQASSRIQDIENIISEKLNGVRETVGAAEQAVMERKSVFEELIQSLQKHEEALKTKIQTTPAMQFWKDKLNEHIRLERQLRRALLWFAALAGLSLVVLCVIFYRSGIMLTGIPLWATVALGGFSVSFVWAGRLLVRMFLEQAALKEDAKERSVFAESYLSFVAQNMVEKEHFGIILQALFRHAGSGGGTDDSSPTLPQEVLVKTLTGSKS